MTRHATFDIKDIEKLKIQVNAEQNPVKYLAIDPGKFCGVCGYDDKFYLQFMYVVRSIDIVQFIYSFDHINTCVIEDYRLFPNKAMKQVYSTMETTRVLGRVEGWAEVNNITLVQQPSKIKPTGYAWIGEKPPTKSSNQNDTMDAHVHFMYWAVLNKKIKAEQLFKNKPVHG